MSITRLVVAVTVRLPTGWFTPFSVQYLNGNPPAAGGAVNDTVVPGAYNLENGVVPFVSKRLSRVYTVIGTDG